MVRELLNDLKQSLNKDNMRLVQTESGSYWGRFTFNEPADEQEIDIIAKENNIIIPADYKEFLLLHNGARLFEEEYGGRIEFFSLDHIKENYSEVNELLKCYYSESISKDSYPIGYVSDIGYIMIDNMKVREGNNKYMWLIDIEPVDFLCDFETWLGRIIASQGNSYWKWRSKLVKDE